MSKTITVFLINIPLVLHSKFLSFKVLAQSIPELPVDRPITIQKKIPNSNLELITPVLEAVKCSQSSDSPTFWLKKVKVVGNTILETEINLLTQKLADSEVSFEDLVCLRSQITQLYIQQGYITTGAYIPNNQDITDGIIIIKVIEGKLEQVQLTGLKRLGENYILKRLQSKVITPFNQQDLETALQLLILDPLISQVRGELKPGSKLGTNILLLDIEEAPAFNITVQGDNYRSASIGELQGSVILNHNNLLGVGDRIDFSISLTEGLELYNLGYRIPLNSSNGTIEISYDRSDSTIIEDDFRDLDIESETDTWTLNLRQPLFRTPQTEFAIGANLDIRRRRTFLQNEPFNFTSGTDDGQTNVTVLRLNQDWLNRNSRGILAAQSQLNLGLDAFDATTSNTEPDGIFWSWQGQFQGIWQISGNNLLIARIGTQLTPDSLLSLEKFSIGGINTVRGYRENQLVSDNGIIGSLELRIPLTEKPQTLQLTPFFDIGTGWNNKNNLESSTLASVGVGLRLSLSFGLNARLDYGIPLMETNNQGNSLQENGLHFSLSFSN